MKWNNVLYTYRPVCVFNRAMPLDCERTEDTLVLRVEERLEFRTRTKPAERLEHVDGTARTTRTHPVHCIKYVDRTTVVSVELLLNTSTEASSTIMGVLHHDAALKWRHTVCGHRGR